MSKADPRGETAPRRIERRGRLPRPRQSPRRLLLTLVLVGIGFALLRSPATQTGCKRLTQQLEAAPAPSAPLGITAPPGEPACRVLEVIEQGRLIEPAVGRVTFEWARRLCTSHASPGGAPYRLSDAGISVQCACD